MSDVLSSLAHRRSAAVKFLQDPGPSTTELNSILTVASRVPDHGRLVPWRFLLIQGKQRDSFADVMVGFFKEKNAEAEPAKIAALQERFKNVPLTIVVIGKIQPHAKIPEIEQTLSVGAVCMNLLNAAHALGYGAVWLTGWAAFDKDFQQAIGMSPEEMIAGFIHVGTEIEKQADRQRPVLTDIVSHYGGN